MNQEMKERYDVFSIHEFISDKQIKTAWTRLGVAFLNKDGSFNLRLRALPLTDPKTGTANLHMRLHVDNVDREEGETKAGEDETCPETFPYDASEDVL